MDTFSLVGVLLLLLFITQNQAFSSTCGITNFSETLIEREGNFTNITYLLNSTEPSFFTDKIIFAFDVCKSNMLINQCTFEWNEKNKQMTFDKWGSGDDAVCSVKRCELNSSSLTWEIQISQLVSRSSSVIKLYLENNTLKERTVRTIRMIRLDLFEPPKVTSLTVDGQQVNGIHLINEGQEVTISCYFNKGNPPVVFHLLNSLGKNLTKSEGPLEMLLTAQCKDDWPTVRCQGNGSERNRSLSFLVRCPPQFVGESVKFVRRQLVDDVTFRVKAHTTSVKECLLTSLSLDFAKKVKCSLSGDPPNLILSLLVDKDGSSLQGNWTLTLHNERGFSNTTLSFIEASESIKPVFNVSLPIVVVVPVTGVVVVAAVIMAVKMVKKCNHGNPKMSCQLKNTSGPFQIQCLFPEVTDGKGDFSVYFNSFNGPAAELMVSCTHNGKFACIPDEVGVKYEDLSTATINVTETFAKKNGTFSCQRGDLPTTNKCQFPFSEDVNLLNSFNSKVDRVTTTHGVSTLRPEQFENGDGNNEAIIGGVVGVAVSLVLIVVIAIIVYRRFKSKKRRKLPAHSNKERRAQFVNVVNEGNKTKNQLENLIRPNTPKEINTQISGDKQGSTLNKPQENGVKGHNSAESKRNDSGSGLEKESGSSPSGSEESNSPLISRDREKNQPI